MPLLNRKPFTTEPPPADLDEKEEIFVCRQTNEVFRDYESFFKRTILCNSLVWSCEVTLKHSLTYEEALDSENEARSIAKNIPLPLQRGALTLVHYTRHSRLDNLCDEVFSYIRDRFQEGEEVDVKYNNEKYVGFIHNVIEPTSTLTNGFGSPKSTKSPKIKSPSSKTLPGNATSNDDVIVIPDDDKKNEECKSRKTSSWPDPKSYQYQIRIKNHGIPEIITVKQPKISRKKGAFSRDKLRLLLRVTCCRSTVSSEDGYWKVIDEYREKFDLSPDVDEKIASMPIVKTTKKRKEKTDLTGEKKGKKRKMSPSEAKDKNDKSKKSSSKEGGKPKKEKDVKKMTPEEIEKIKLEMKLHREKEKEEQKRKREVEREIKKKERDKARQEKQDLLREQKMFLLRWCAPQEDLDLSDLRELPTSKPIQCKFPGEMFGTMVMILEFLQIFGEFFDIKNDFPDGITFEMLEGALTEHDAEGVFYDIIRFLLDCILKTHAEEEEEEGLDDSDVHEETEQLFVNEEDQDSDFTRLKKAVSASAAMAASWAQLHQGKNLQELNLDPFTLSEILRLHFLSSGANLVSGPDGDTYRWQRRGGFTFSDDAGVAFRHNEHDIMRGLVTRNIYGFEPENKLKVMSTLCTQLLTYATARDIIDDGFDRWRKVRRELQEEQWADQRKDKEEAAAKLRKQKEERAKAKEEREKEKERKLAELKGENVVEMKDVSQDKNDSSMEKPEGNCEQDVEGKAYTRSQGPVVVDDRMIVDDENEEEYEREERKERFRKKEKAYSEELRKSQAMCSVQPLGCDRIFRRYWVFNSIKGLFIEQSDNEYQKLLQPSKKELQDEESSDEDTADDSMSDSIEDDASNVTTPLDTRHDVSCVLTKQQIGEEKELCRILKLYSIPLECLPDDCSLTRLKNYEKRDKNIASTKPADSQWSYIDNEEGLSQLLSTLNPRGHRERILRENLVQHYDAIMKGLEDNPVRKETRERNDMLQRGVPVAKRGARNQPQAVDKTLYETMEDFIEANLRDQILDLEDRIYHAGFGNLKVPDITVWRKKVENNIYEFLPDTGNTTWDTASGDNTGNKTPGDDTQGKVPEDKIPGDKNGDEALVNGASDDGCSPEQMEVDEVVRNIKQIGTLQNVEVSSRPGTPVDGSFVSTPTTSLTPQAINPCVRKLANAVLELEEGVERKYLLPPLGDDEETKKRKLQEAADAAQAEFDEMMAAANKKKKANKSEENVKNENGNDDSQTKEETVPKAQKTLIERWRGSLMASTNLSQVFIHLSNLDNSVAWDKSVLNARCRICRRKGDAEHMLLCDGCDRGHHMYCLKPPIKEIPEGDWFCELCRPKEPRRSFRRAGRKTVESDDEETGVDYKMKSKLEESDSDEDESSDEESEDEEESDEDEDDTVNDDIADNSDEDGSIHMETCACCDGEGELLCCETCPLAYHLECAYPSLRRIPRGNWACQVCTGSESELPSGLRVKKSVIKAAHKKVTKGEATPPAAKKVKIPARKKETKTPVTTTKRQISSNTSSPASAPTKNAPPVRTSGRKTTPSTTTPTSQSKSTHTTSNTKAKSTPSSTHNAKSKSTPTSTTQSSKIKSTPSSTTPNGQSKASKTSNVKWTAAQSKKCEKLLKELQDHEDAILFLYPVDVTEVPDYPLIIETPMDFNTIQTKLSSSQYHTMEQFVSDIRQIFFNCSEYNKPRSREARAGVRLSAFFETHCAELGLDGSDNIGSRNRRSK